MAEKREISISTGTILKVVGILLACGFLWLVRDVVAIIFVAVLLAALIDPFADWFQKYRIPRALAVLVIYFILLLILGLVLIVIVPPFIEQFTALLINFGYYDQVSEYLGNITKVDWHAEVTGNFGQITDSLQQVFNTVSGFFAAIAATAIVLVLTFYMVVEEESARSFFKSIAPKKYEPHLAKLIVKMQKKIGMWLRGQIILGLVVGIAVYIGLSIIGVQYALVLAIIAGLFEVVPYIGPIAASIPAIVLAFLQDPIKGLMTLVLYVAVQQLENNILVPKIMQKVVGLNPVVSIVALMVGFNIFGIVGAILAVPVATMIAVLIEDLFSDEKFWKNV